MTPTLGSDDDVKVLGSSDLLPGGCGSFAQGEEEFGCGWGCVDLVVRGLGV